MAGKDKYKNYFKLHGYILEPKAIVHLCDQFKEIDFKTATQILDKLISAFNELHLINNKITVEIIDKAFSIRQSDTSSLKLFQVIDAPQIPLLKVNNETKKFYKIDEKSDRHFTKLISDNADRKSEIFQNRFQIIYQRIMRNHLLSFKNSMKTIEYLLSCGVAIKTVVVCGMLSQYRDNRWFLEDSSGIIEINLARAQFHKGLVFEGSFVLAEGRYDDGIIYISTIGMPPLESSIESRAAIQSRTNYFGGLPLNDSVKSSAQMTRAAQSEISGKSLIFLSEVWLDKEIVLDKIKILFHGYDKCKPTAFIFCGNFLSPDTINLNPSEKLSILKQSIKTTIRLFAQCKDLALVSHLVFVPGPGDPFQGLRNVLPRPSLPRNLLMDDLQSFSGLTKVEFDELKERIIFASSPCRITFYDREIVVFRDSITQKLYRHCLHIPSRPQDDPDEAEAPVDDSVNSSIDNSMTENSVIDLAVSTNNQWNLESHLVWSVLSQAHLMPLPIHVSPVFWGLDHTLQLFPAPDLLIISDPSASPFDISVNRTLVSNPHHFSCGDHFPFKIYYPYKSEMQSCNLDI